MRDPRLPDRGTSTTRRRSRMSGSSSASKRNAFAVVSALILSLAIESQATAAPAWTVPTAVTASPATVYGMATGGPSTLVIVYSESTGIFLRRSTNSGSTWGSAEMLAATPAPAAVAGYGSDVDVAWVDGSKLVYMRSTDGGASFGSAQVLADTTTLPPADSHRPRSRWHRHRLVGILQCARARQQKRWRVISPRKDGRVR